jgi:hypothetical protein
MIEMSCYPGLACLAPLYSNDGACERIASALSPSVISELIGSGITRAAPRRTQTDELSMPYWLTTFRTNGASWRFRLAEREAVLVLLRGIAS